MGMLSGNPKDQPLNYGEAITIWTNFATNNGLIAAYQTLYNHTGDKELGKLLEEAIQCCREENEQLETLLKVNGIALPPAPPERPNANLEDIPAGAKFNDPEICAMLAADTATGLMACSQALGMSIREDIAMMYAQFHMKKGQFAGKVLKLEKEKGWLVMPPLHLNYPDE